MKKYLEFNGNASRSEYWGVYISAYILLMFISLISIWLISAGTIGSVIGGVLIVISFVFITWASIATAARRCRDAGINPWFTATLCIPYFAVVPWIIFGCLSTEKKND